MKSIAHSDPGVNQTPLVAHATMPSGVSFALATANRRLLALRDQLQTAHTARQTADSAESNANSAETLPCLPPHLGWHTLATTQVLQRQANRLRIVNREQHTKQNQSIKQVQKQVSTANERLETKVVKAYPALLAALQRAELTAPGRVWLLCRYLDQDGRGWMPIDELQQRLTKKVKGGRRKAEATDAAPSDPLSFALFGRRRLRQILQQGRGIFWERDAQGRLWLYGAARVAAQLGVERLSGRPVLLPVAALTDSLATARAHFYAAFHSGRSAIRRGEHAAPISRATLQQVTHVPERTQRAYDQLVGVERRPTLALGKRYSAENAREAAWERGTGTFVFIDHHGQQGESEATYVAWQLPNAYRGVHVQAARGRHKKINKKLAEKQSKATNQHTIHDGLVEIRERGNGMNQGRFEPEHCQTQTSEPRVERLFFNDAKRVAARSSEAYWLPTSAKNRLIWHCIAGMK